MKVLFLNAYGNGSTGRIVDSLKTECRKKGIEAISIYARETCNSPSSSVRCFNKIDFYLDAFFTRIFDNHGLNSIFNTRKILKIIDDFAPDIIHIHNLHGYWINYRMLFKYIKENSIKIVWTFHDCWNFTGHCTHFDYIGCYKWTKECFCCPQKREYPTSFFRDESKKNYKLKKACFSKIDNLIVVTPSKWLEEQVKKSFFKENSVRTINNGIDVSKFKYVNSVKRKKILSKNYSHIILAVAGDWVPKKGLSIIVEMAQMKKEWMFVIIGNIPANKDSLIKKENIMLVKRTESIEELAEWYSCADVFVNPTLEDNYPTTNLEAIACGTPVATFPTGGSVEIVEKTGYGIVSKEKNTSSLLVAIEKMIENMPQYGEYRELLDAKVKFREYIQLYEEIADR